MSAKNDLQEFLQKRGCGIPKYEEVGNSGPSHSPLFEYNVSVKWTNGQEFCEKATGKNKKNAQQTAAENMLKRLMAQEGELPPKVTIYSQALNSEGLTGDGWFTG